MWNFLAYCQVVDFGARKQLNWFYPATLFREFQQTNCKNAKVVFLRHGFIVFLLKINNAGQILTHPFKGALFENMMIVKYVKHIHYKNLYPDVWFWRNSAGHEVNLIVQDGLNLNRVEIKATQAIIPGRKPRHEQWPMLFPGPRFW